MNSLSSYSGDPLCLDNVGPVQHVARCYLALLNYPSRDCLYSNGFFFLKESFKQPLLPASEFWGVMLLTAAPAWIESW